jgi:uncharacterized damage-inducible protein DinB
MNRADITLLFEYNYWANKRILTAASRISPEQFVAPTAFPRGSLRATLLHILDAEYGWRELLDHRREVPDLAPADFPSVAAVEALWAKEEAAMREFLATLTDEKLNMVVRYTNLQGIQRERVLWHGLFHVVNHGTQHRSEAAAMLTDFGQSPGDVDFSIFTVAYLQSAHL